MLGHAGLLFEPLVAPDGITLYGPTPYPYLPGAYGT